MAQDFCPQITMIERMCPSQYMASAAGVMSSMSIMGLRSYSSHIAPMKTLRLTLSRPRVRNGVSSTLTSGIPLPALYEGGKQQNRMAPIHERIEMLYLQLYLMCQAVCSIVLVCAKYFSLHHYQNLYVTSRMLSLPDDYFETYIYKSCGQ